MATIAAARPRAQIGVSSQVAFLVACAVVGVLAALPRLTGQPLPVTADEAHWFERSSRFADAVINRDWAGTYRTATRA